MLQCSEPEIVNYTKEWNQFDQDTLNRAKRRCGQIYKDAPCIKVFMKLAEKNYHVICKEIDDGKNY